MESVLKTAALKISYWLYYDNDAVTDVSFMGYGSKSYAAINTASNYPAVIVDAETTTTLITVKKSYIDGSNIKVEMTTPWPETTTAKTLVLDTFKITIGSSPIAQISSTTSIALTLACTGGGTYS